MEKINAVYSVSNTVNGGMKATSRTEKEINDLHGDVKTYELNKPQPIEIVDTWPVDIQKEYFKRLYWTHMGSQAAIADMLGVYQKAVCDKMSELGIPARPKKGITANEYKRRKSAWNAFLRGGTLVKEMIPAETANELLDLKGNLATEERSKKADDFNAELILSRISDIEKRLGERETKVEEKHTGWISAETPPETPFWEQWRDDDRDRLVVYRVSAPVLCYCKHLNGEHSGTIKTPFCLGYYADYQGLSDTRNMWWAYEGEEIYVDKWMILTQPEN